MEFFKMKQNGVIIITGAGGGLGSEVAAVAHEAGFPVALVGRTKATLERVKKDLERRTPTGAKVSVHTVDLTKEKATHQEFARIAKAHGKIRGLVNNAATWMGTTTVEKFTTAEIRKSLDLNFFSAVHASTATIKMTGSKPKTDLAIINVGATTSLDAWMEVLPFSLAKGALRDFSRALSRSVGPNGVHVAHLVIDGMLDNERTRKLNRSLPANRFLKTRKVAESIFQVMMQDQSAWTMEWDIRPYNENW
jgi:short-subunit dehydrogenase